MQTCAPGIAWGVMLTGWLPYAASWKELGGGTLCSNNNNNNNNKHKHGTRDNNKVFGTRLETAYYNIAAPHVRLSSYK